MIYCLTSGVFCYAKRSTKQTIYARIQKDVTEFSLFGEKLYLSPILDLHSSDLVSYTVSDRPVLSMVTTMLDEAFAKIPAGTTP